MDIAKGKKGAKTLGHVVHNKEVVDELKEQDISPVRSISEIERGTLVINAHGNILSTIKAAEKKGLNVVDTTCPFVKKIHDIVKKFDKQEYPVIIFGDKEHIEIKAIASRCENPIIIKSETDADDLPEMEKAVLVSQTTQSLEDYDIIKKILRKKVNELNVYDTICNSTIERQNAAQELAKTVDLMIVIGDKTSGNTKRLYELCEAIVETRWIEKADQLKDEWFMGKIVGITAGASTPEKTIERVLAKLTDKQSGFTRTLLSYQRVLNKEIEYLFREKMLQSPDFEPYLNLLKSFGQDGGKKLRPISLIMAYMGVGGKGQIIREALSVEFLHNSSLIHDDIIDEDEKRRGRDTIFQQQKKEFLSSFKDRTYSGPVFSKLSTRFGVSNAIVLGNILYSYGADCLINSKLDKNLINRAALEYHKCYAVVNQGELMDTLLEFKSSEDEQYYIDMAMKKTSALIATSIRIGGILGGASEQQLTSLDQYSMNAALAFQLKDDLMDLCSKAKKGRQKGSDIRQGKKTLIIIRALERLKEPDKQKLLNVLGRSDATDKEIDEAIDLLESSGAINYVDKLANNKIDEAKKHLLKANLSKDEYDFFNGFADFMVERTQ